MAVTYYTAHLTAAAQATIINEINSRTGTEWLDYSEAFQGLEASMEEMLGYGETDPRARYEIGSHYTASKRPEIINADRSMFAIEITTEEE